MTATMTPGIHDIPEEQYFSQPGLSASGVKQLLDCPARFHWLQTNPQPHKDVFDVGSAAHKLVLGAGPEIGVVDADDWRTKAAREKRDELRANGLTPVLAKDFEVVQSMAAALRGHPVAMSLLDPDLGAPEQSLFRVQDGIPLRSRFDWLPHTTGEGHVKIPDYKTAVSADPEAFARSAANFGYHIQDVFYSDMLVALGMAESASVQFIVQEKEAPYLVSIIELDSEFKRIGRELVEHALNLYRECREHDSWPGYGDHTRIVEPPRWLVSQHDWRFRK